MNKYVRNTLIYAFLMMMMMNFTHPITPKLVSERFNDPVIIGYLFSAMSFGSLVSSKIIGRIWDKTQSKWMIILPFPIGYGIGQYLMAIAQSPQTMILARFISGPFGAGLFFVVLPAMISEFSNNENRDKNQLYFYISFSLASPVGYFFGGHLGEILNPTMVVKLQALLCLFMIFPGILLLSNGSKYKTRSKKYKKLRTIQDSELIPNCDCTKKFFNHHLYTFLLFALPALIIVTPLTKIYDTTINAYGISTGKLGSFVLLNGVMATLFMVFIGRKLIKKYNKFNIASFSFITCGILIAIIAAFKNVNILIILYPLIYGLGMFGRTAITATVAERFKNHSGEALGIAKAFADIGFIIGPIFLAYIFDRNLWLTYTVSVILISLSGIIILLTRNWLNKKLWGTH